MKVMSCINYFFLFLLVVMFSCTVRYEDDLINDNTFSDLSIEEGKKKIENSGSDLLDEMKRMENGNAMEVYLAFISFLDSSDPLEDSDYYNKSATTDNMYGISTIRSLATMDQSGMAAVLKSMLSMADDPETLEEVFDLLIGIYSWNDRYQKWDYLEIGSKMVFNFPSTMDGNENDASYIIDYKGVDINNNRWEDEYIGDFPQMVTAELKLDGTRISHSISEFEYDGEGMVTSFEFSYYIDEYLMYATFENKKNEDAEVAFLFQKEAEILMDLKLTATGDWSDDNVDDHMTYFVEYYDYDEHRWVEIEVDSDDDYDYFELEFYNVVTHGNAIFQVMDIRLTGDIDIQNLGRELEELYEERDDHWDDWDDDDDKEFNENEIEALNKYVNLAVRDAANNEILALCEYYLVEDEYTGSQVTEFYYEVGLRFVFADGSKIDAETYFDDDFDDLVDELESWIEDLEEKYDD